ncbi:MAG: Na+/H+ antiporter NhaC family protein [Planctomycetota bacterium]
MDPQPPLPEREPASNTPAPHAPGVAPNRGGPLLGKLLSPKLWLFAGLLLFSAYLGQTYDPSWTVQRSVLDVYTDDQGLSAYSIGGDEVSVAHAVPVEQAELTADKLNALQQQGQAPASTSEFVYTGADPDGVDEPAGRRYFELTARQHYGYWSLLPAGVAIALCVFLREPLTALFASVVSGGLLLGQYDITDELLVPALQKDGVAEVLLLYCGLLGGLLGIWSYTGSARAFAEAVARRFVRGPRSAKLVGWGLGVTFFQGATISSVMVGSTVKPVSDREKVSHEEMSYIVDSTASPIAALIAFNGWPAYVQALIFVPGVAFLATEADRIGFYFASTFLGFYALFAVASTFLLSIEKLPLVGKRMRAAMARSRTTGQLDAPDANPLQAEELETNRVPEGFRPSPIGFFLPLGVLMFTVIATFVGYGSPNTNWAFFAAFLAAGAIALWRGLTLFQLIDAVSLGVKSVAIAGLILVLAITLGDLSQATGADAFLVDRLGETVPYWGLPLALVLMTMGISFATGTSWGTYAVAFPLGMPLAWTLAQAQGLEHPELYMMVCFATILNGSLFGDQCSPISDTTVLSSMSVGADLMDHVRTQILPASVAMGLAIVCWTAVVLWFA